jgi:HD-GYP domain-containing protein (c-di-GMP phosphodiesterase class II)
LDKFEFEGNSFFKIEITQLKGAVPLPFPLFVHMKMNAAMILRYSIGQAPTQTELERYVKKGLQYFACPEKHHPDWLNYLSSLQAPVAPPPAPITQPVAAPVSEPIIEAGSESDTPQVEAVASLKDKPQFDVEPAPDIEKKVRPQDSSTLDAYLANAGESTTEEELAPIVDLEIPAPLNQQEATELQTMQVDEKKAKMQDMGQKMLKSLVDIASGDQLQKWEALRECQQVTQSIVQIGIDAYKNKTIYEDLVALSGPEIEHSTAVATISTIFAMICGYFDESELADLSMSGLLHDIGLALVPPDIANKPMHTWSDRDFKIVREHPLEGAQILEEFGAELSPLVKQVIFQHHERFDGSGYPKKLRGIQIDERIQIVHLADLVADYMRGNVTGKEMNPEQAFKLIKASQLDRSEQYISYELFEPIQQVALKGKNIPIAAAVLQKTGS